MKVLVALDKFKYSFTATEGCSIIAETAADILQGAEIIQAPLTDGGEGFVEILTKKLHGQQHRVAATGPLFEKREAIWGLCALKNIATSIKEKFKLPIEGTLAIAEMAQSSGLELVPKEKRNPWNTTTYGTGEVLADIAFHMPDAILLGIGGSATNDIGVGCLEALGLELFDFQDKIISQSTPTDWKDIDGIRGHLKDLPSLYIACDVKNPLIGPNGATAIYGKQKGLTPDSFPTLEAQVEAMGKRLCHYFEASEDKLQFPGGGAAGGIAFGLHLAYNAKLISGFNFITECLKIDDHIKSADLIITGEGRLDDSSFSGKGPGAVIQKSIAYDKRVIILAGQVTTEAKTWLKNNISKASAYLLAPDGYTIQQSIIEGPSLLAARTREALKRL